MSEADDGPGLREVAYRLFATEYDDASLEYSESDEERAPNYVVTPTGARVNRLFVVGVLTAVESVNEETVRARIVDPTGAFVVYAGQYQPEALAFFERAEPPAFVSMAGKANTFQPDGSDRVLTSLRPENVNEVDAETRDRWVVTAAEQTLSRIAVTARAIGRDERGNALETVLRESGVDAALADGLPRTLDHYGTTADYLGQLRRVALDALAVVAEERDDVRPLSVEPDDRTDEYRATVIAEQAPAAPSIEAAEDVTSADADATATGSPDEAAASAQPASGGAATDVGTGETSSGTDMGSNTAQETDATAPTSGEADASTTADSGQSDAGRVQATAGASGEPGSAGEQPDSTGADTPTAATGDATTETGAESDATTSTSDRTGGEPEGGDTLGNFEPRGSEDQDDSLEDEPIDPDTDPEELYEVDEEEREEIESEYGVEFSSGTEVDDPGEADIDVPTADTDADTASSGESPTDGEASGTDAETATTEAGSEDGEPTVTSTTGETLQETESESDSETGGDLVDDDVQAESGQEATSETADTSAAADAADTSTVAEDTVSEGADAEDTPDEADGDEEADADVDDVLFDRMNALDDGDGADREELIAAVVDETGASEETIEEAIDDALMSGQCYEPDETTLKPI
jgi:RPA family protein